MIHGTTGVEACSTTNATSHKYVNFMGTTPTCIDRPGLAHYDTMQWIQQPAACRAARLQYCSIDAQTWLPQVTSKTITFDAVDRGFNLLLGN
jgi:hypothetical protein